jgi:hypothetical protein
LECLAMKDVGKFYGHSVYITAILYILWPFGIFMVILVYFSVLVCCSKKIWQPWSNDGGNFEFLSSKFLFKYFHSVFGDAWTLTFFVALISVFGHKVILLIKNSQFYFTSLFDICISHFWELDGLGTNTQILPMLRHMNKPIQTTYVLLLK